jgi:hypothetical protein
VFVVPPIWNNSLATERMFMAFYSLKFVDTFQFSTTDGIHTFMEWWDLRGQGILIAMLAVA